MAARVEHMLFHTFIYSLC